MLFASLVTLLLIVTAIIRWQLAHPLPIYWDEANYACQARIDQNLIARGGVTAAIKALLFEDPQRPPAYRVFAMPWSFFWTPSLPFLRALSLTGSLIALGFLWRAACVVASPEAALAGVAAIFVMPGVFLSAGWYGTEFPLFLAIAVLLNSILREQPVGVIIAVAIGCLAKLTFFVIAAPAILAYLLFRRRAPVVVAAIPGIALAAPWWFYHWRDAIGYARYGAGGARWVAHGAIARMREFLLHGTGPAGVVVLLMVVVGLRRFRTLPERTRHAVVIALAGSLPLLAAAAASPVFVARHFSPAFMPLAIVVAVYAGGAPRAARIFAAVLVVQAAAYACLTPQLLPAVEQIDWTVVRSFIPGRRPTVSILGVFQGFSLPEIRYAWLRTGADADVRWLWSADDKSIDWDRVTSEALSSDAIMIVSPDTVRSLSGFERIDNAHNGELLARLQSRGEFAEARTVTVGTLAKRNVVVLMRRHAPTP